MAMYHYTKSTSSQSLTVVERTISDLRLITVDTCATHSMNALSTLELRGGPEHAKAICLTLIAPFIKHL